MNLIKIIYLTLIVMAMGASFAEAGGVLMVDFGSTTVTGADQTNSPYHSVNGAFTETSWNKATADLMSGVVWSDGTAATGVTIDVGDTAKFGDTTLGLASAVAANALGRAFNTGIYSGTSVGKDAIFASGKGTRHVGCQVGGLGAGTYDVYLAGRNTNSSQTGEQIFLVGTSSAAGNFDFSGYSSQTLSYSGSTSPTIWNGECYVKFTVTLGAGEYLNMASVGKTGELRGFLNSAQIVAVPQP